MVGDDGLCGELPELMQQLLDEQRVALLRSKTQSRLGGSGETAASFSVTEWPSTHGIDVSQPIVKGSYLMLCISDFRCPESRVTSG